jgi:cyanoexosortase A
MVSPLRQLDSTIRGQVLPAWHHQWRRHAGNRRSLWLLLAVLLFCWSALQFTWADLSPNVQVLNLMVWFGCLIALEDQLPALWPRPSRLSLFCGSTLLAAILWRGSWITNVHDRFTYLLPSLLMLGLALINQSGPRLRMFRVPFVISLLFPLGMRLLTFADHLQGITTMLSWLILASLGFNPLVTGNQITLPTGSVSIAGYCTGVDQLAICLVVAVIFLLVFPLRRWYHQLLALLVAVAAALGVNSVRIAILALLVAIPERGGMTVFGFLHDSYGGLVFSLIAVGIFGWFYTLLVDRELAAAVSYSRDFPLNPDS